MTDSNPKILIVDDRPENLVALERTLSDLKVDFVRASSGNDALKETQLHDFAIALIDVQMAGMDGFETVTLMREEKRTAHLPVIFLSAIYKEDYYQIKGIKAGAVDFITKPIVPEILIGKVKVFLDLYKKEHALKTEITRRIAYEKALTASEARQIDLNVQLREKLDELSLSEERFKSLVLTIPDIVYRIDQNGCFTFINRAIERLGYAVEDLMGAHFSKIVLPDDLERVSRQVVLQQYKNAHTGAEKSPRFFDERRTGDRRTMGLEVRLLSKAGNFQEGVLQDLDSGTMAVEINSTGIYKALAENDTRKMFIGTVGVIRDISERKQREKSIQRQRMLFEGISHILLKSLTCDTPEAVTAVALATAVEICASPFGFMGVFDGEGTFKAATVGDAQWQPWGISQRQVTQLLAGRKIRKNLESICKSGRSQFFNQLPGPPAGNTGRPPLNAFMGAPLLQGDMVCGIMVLANKKAGYDEEDRQAIEALASAAAEALNRKRIEIKLKLHQEKLEMLVERRAAALRESQAQFIEAEKLGALGILTAGIAHELNNPMMGMLNYAQYSLKHVPETSKAFPVLKDMVQETERCINIVKNLLTFSRMEGADHEIDEKIQVAILIDRVASLLKYRFEKENVTISRSGDDELPDVWARVSNLQQVFLNLIANALDALEGVKAKQIRIQAACEADFVDICISDNGCGIPDEPIAKIFDPFFTTKPPGKGTGLGLSVCRNIVEAHKGTISCKSQPGKGTTFRIRLPRQPEKPGG